MSVFSDARNIYRAIRNNPVAIKQKRDEYLAAAGALTAANGQMQITESNVNGQGFTAKHGATPSETLAILAQVIKFLDAGNAGGTRTIGRFL